MKSHAAAIAFSVLLPSAAAAADVESLLRSMAGDQQELQQAQLQQSELVRLNEQDQGLYKTYKDNNQELEGRVRRVKKTRDDYVAPRQAERNRLVDGWNNHCSAKIVGALPKERYEACGRERAQIEPRTSELGRQVEQAYANAKREADPLINAMERQASEMDKIAQRMKSRFDAWQRGKVKVDQLKAKLEQTRLQLVSACSDADSREKRSPESLKHCHSIGWDGASRTLPPLSNIRPTFAATRN